MRLARSPVLHPVLFAAFPVVSLWAHNVSEVRSAREPLFLAVLSVSFSGSFLVVLTMMLRDWRKAGIVVSFFLFLFFSYGHVAAILCPESLTLCGRKVARDSVLFPAFMALMVAVTVLVARARGELRGVTTLLNVLAAGLLVFSGIQVGSYTVANRRSSKGGGPVDTLGIVATAPPDTLRDIYYIILDRYASQATLHDVFSYNNGPFLDYLRGRGFYVASESHSNYLKTFLSLASTLNMEYLDYLTETIGRDSDNKVPVYEMLRSYRVWRFLKAHGYRFLHFGSWWEPTRENTYADRNYNTKETLPEFAMTLYRNTMAYPVATRSADSSTSLDFRRTHWERVQYKFAELAEVPDHKEPTFVFAHMLIPHSPYVFDSAGSFLSWEEANSRGRVRCYVEQLTYVNRRVIELVDRLIDGSEAAPIIIIQADEGPYPEDYERLEWRFDWRKATRAQYREKVRILNAFYLPGRGNDKLYPSISPVNTFRLVFDLYFNTQLELLPDRSYASADDCHPYNFFDITDKVDFR